MALKRAPLAHETTQTTGTGNYALDGVIDAEHAPFDQDMNTGDTVYMMVRGDGSNWEINLSTFTSPSTLSRNVLLSAAAGVVGATAINWATGVKDVYSLPDIDFVSQADFLAAANNLSDVADAGASRNNLGLGSAALLNTGQVVRTDVATNTVSNATGNTLLELIAASGTDNANLVLGEGSAVQRALLSWQGSTEDLGVFIHDGVDLERVFRVQQNAVTFDAGVVVTLAQDAVSALEAVTKQQLDAAIAGALLYSTGDETIFGGAALPPGTSIVTTAANNRVPLFVDTLAETKANAGANAINALSVTVNSHTLTTTQIPGHTHSQSAHTHNVTVHAGQQILTNPGGALTTMLTDFRASGGAGIDSQTYTSTSDGGGNTGSTGGGDRKSVV